MTRLDRLLHQLRAAELEVERLRAEMLAEINAEIVRQRRWAEREWKIAEVAHASK